MAEHKQSNGSSWACSLALGDALLKLELTLALAAFKVNIALVLSKILDLRFS
jgi:hypothetical protein